MVIRRVQTCSKEGRAGGGRTREQRAALHKRPRIGAGALWICGEHGKLGRPISIAEAKLDQSRQSEGHTERGSLWPEAPSKPHLGFGLCGRCAVSSLEDSDRAHVVGDRRKN